MKRKSTVRISTEMARGESLPTLTKTKGLRALLMLIEQRTEGIKAGDVYEISMETFRQAMRCRDDRFLKSEMEGLVDIKINWAKYFSNLTGYTRPLPTCILNLETETVTFTFDNYFVERWMNNSLGFRRISWEVLVAFSSLYAAKIYEYCAMSFEKGKTVTTRVLTIEELRELLGVPLTAYSHSIGPFFREISKAIAAVNAAQDGFRVTYSREGRGRNSSHWFEVSPAPKQERLPLNTPVVTGGTLRGRVAAALDALSIDKRLEVDQALRREGFLNIPEDITLLKSYAGQLRANDVEIPSV